ncbi:MAG TPA: ABATE domain-containing protein [Pyrinomonadaceae bacterium]
MAGAHEQEYSFELVGGHLCLDFVNTLNGSRDTGVTEEKLESYADFVSWSRQAGVISEREARRLLNEAGRRPTEAEKIRRRAVALREAIYRVFTAAASERAPAQADLKVLNDVLSEAMSQAQIVKSPEGFVWDWSKDDAALERLLWPVSRSAAELLVSDNLSRARVCGADDCTWLFMDTSKNRSRRWCDMKYCGNRSKARRHYQRKRDAAEESKL